MKADPPPVDALLGVATCLYDLRQFQPALAAAEFAQQHVTDSLDRRALLWLLSRLYRALGEPSKAIENERLLAGLEAAKNGDLVRFRTLQEEAMSYRAAHDFAKVAETLEEALRIERRQDSLVMLGDAYRALKRPQDAEKCYLEALAAGPEAEAYGALVALGYRPQEATQLLKAGETGAALGTEELIRRALQGAARP